MVLGPAAQATLVNLLEMQIFGLHSRPTRSETLRVGPRNLALLDDLMMLKFDDYWYSGF